MTTIYWEDFKVGTEVEIGSHTFTEEEIIDFARQFDPQPFHIDPEAAKRSAFGGLIASGWHTCSISMRFICENYVNKAVSMGSPGVDMIRWPNPVRAGDTITFRRKVTDARASNSRPDMGLVKTYWDGINQCGETVVSMEGWGMFGRRPK